DKDDRRAAERKRHKFRDSEPEQGREPARPLYRSHRARRKFDWCRMCRHMLRFLRIHLPSMARVSEKRAGRKIHDSAFHARVDQSFPCAKSDSQFDLARIQRREYRKVLARQLDATF